MFLKKDPAHLLAMSVMQDLMKDAAAMQEWFEQKKKSLKLYRAKAD
jgi:hypothetical protein